MTVQDLLDFLEAADPEAEVVIAHQPSHPLEARVLGACSRGDFSEVGDPEDVVIVARESSEYSSRAAWECF